MNLSETLRTKFATRDELAELQKAMDNNIQTAVENTTVAGATDRVNNGQLATADVMITVDYDAELQRLVNHQSPF